MTSKLSRIGLFAAVAMASLSLLGCSKSETVTLSLMLNNQAKENWYLWVGESRSTEGQAMVVPGGFKASPVGMNVRAETEQEDGNFNDSLRLHASKDGKEVKDTVFDIRFPYVPGKTMYVRWDGNEFRTDY
jgi:hypothetical protein